MPTGRRPKTKREVRVALAWQPGKVDDKVVDVHVAPHKRPEFTGNRMYCAALAAGMRDNTAAQGTFDMARWQVLQFGAQPEQSICADFFHAAENIAGAAKGCEPRPEQVSASGNGGTNETASAFTCGCKGLDSTDFAVPPSRAESRRARRLRISTTCARIPRGRDALSHKPGSVTDGAVLRHLPAMRHAAAVADGLPLMFDHTLADLHVQIDQDDG